MSVSEKKGKMTKEAAEIFNTHTHTHTHTQTRTHIHIRVHLGRRKGERTA